MLKIKDNVDLKELEKFGFKPMYDRQTGEIEEYCLYAENKKYVRITKEERKRFIDRVMATIYEDYRSSYFVLIFHDYVGLKAEKEDLLYDLIKADLVEKVSDK